MRRRGSTALALALMILLAPVTVLACERQCAPDTLSPQGVQISTPDPAGSCHRSEQRCDTAESLRSSLHVCASHAIAIITTGPARLNVNRANDVAPVAMLPQPRFAADVARGAAAPLVSRILAPPGPSSGSMTPLRV